MVSRHILILCASGVCGLLFGFGLIVSGMANPAKVLAFLDLAGQWDPSLLLVMTGAVAMAIPGYALSRGRKSSLLGEPLRAPQSRVVDTRLLLGSGTFGVGWGLAGFCPGPALVALGAWNSNHFKVFILVGAMILGMLTFDFLARAGSNRRISAVDGDLGAGDEFGLITGKK